MTSPSDYEMIVKKMVAPCTGKEETLDPDGFWWYYQQDFLKEDVEVEGKKEVKQDSGFWIKQLDTCWRHVSFCGLVIH